MGEKKGGEGTGTVSYGKVNRKSAVREGQPDEVSSECLQIAA